MSEELPCPALRDPEYTTPLDQHLTKACGRITTSAAE